MYSRIDWDFEDHYPTTPDRIRKAIAGITMKFTKVETPAQFPGGDVAGASNELTRLAVEAIEEAPAWLPAHQNGRTVISYKKQVVILGL